MLAMLILLQVMSEDGRPLSELVEEMKRRYPISGEINMRVGDPLDKAIDMGAIVDQTQWDTVDGWVKTGVKEGGDLFQPDIELPEKGLFYPPTLICNLDPAAEVVQEEIFGPVRARRVRLVIQAARAEPTIQAIGFFRAPKQEK